MLDDDADDEDAKCTRRSESAELEDDLLEVEDWW